MEASGVCAGQARAGSGDGRRGAVAARWVSESGQPCATGQALRQNGRMCRGPRLQKYGGFQGHSPAGDFTKHDSGQAK